MTKFAVISDVQIAEGVVASIIFPAILYFMKNYNKKTMYVATLVAWFITWLIRKFTVNTFMKYKTHYNEPVKTYYIDLPFSISIF
jgi:hypothetical protein